LMKVSALTGDIVASPTTAIAAIFVENRMFRSHTFFCTRAL